MAPLLLGNTCKIKFSFNKNSIYLVFFIIYFIHLKNQNLSNNNSKLCCFLNINSKFLLCLMLISINNPYKVNHTIAVLRISSCIYHSDFTYEQKELLSVTVMNKL